MIPVKILAVQYIPNAAPVLCRQLGVSENRPALALLTTDCDDATYLALDEATKAADVTVSYARSFYAGAVNASTPYAGEVLGILAAATPADAKIGMEVAIAALGHIGFSTAREIPYLAHTVSSCGIFLAAEANVPPGTALAYLIAPPLESIFGLDAALKAADVRLCRLYAPPSETNFGGGLLCGSRAACQAACDAFADAINKIAADPLQNNSVPTRSDVHGV